MNIEMYKFFLKPFFDFAFAFAVLIILSPILILIIAMLFFKGNKNVFFKQLRVGKNEKLFKVLKFKTMNDLCDKDGNPLADDKRLTSFGIFLRKSSLDELPQLINVLKGDMSIIGPRPLLVQYIPLYSVEQKKRHLVKPGITGWAQVNGRNSISWTQKFKLDLWYVNNLSFKTDIRILIKTFEKVLKGSDISQDGHATTEAFNGIN